MKKSLRGKIREYIQSEEGKVSVKSPLTLGIAAGGLLLAHAIVGTPQAEAGECVKGEDECPANHTCRGPFIWNGMEEIGTCIPDC
ncbi:hypothetical protein F4009_12345 [Candidatus Poribacteria bacterium]|nr:hypothetical protein [Candidatus Poribacteria bacterium]MYH82727.1 hypothetical protein [Candidatus Poribacteria bacterium]MYK94763.1 hypothetical protein [Candidatus Poribacteria bacterium]